MQSVGHPDTRRQTPIPCLQTTDSVVERWQGHWSIRTAFVEIEIVPCDTQKPYYVLNPRPSSPDGSPALNLMMYLSTIVSLFTPL